MIDEVDPKFEKRKNELQCESTENLLSHFHDLRVFPYYPRDTSKEIMDKNPLIYHTRSYYGMERSGWSNTYRLSLHSRLVRRRPSPVPYIGVGYKDKGSRRNVAEDGSPKWQEVARVSAFKEREAEEHLQDHPPDSLEADP
jgi:hypothetical protein